MSKALSTREWLFGGVLLFSALALVVGRTLSQPLQPYGDGAAQYIEHAKRLELREALQNHNGGLLDALKVADETVLSHPPGLHLITLGLGNVSGHGAEAILWTGILWLLLLGGSVACVVRVLGGDSRAQAAGALGTLLIPALNAAATRYHYDLPMTSLLWASVAALLLGMQKRRILGSLLAALLFTLAAVVKWTALPFGGVMLLAAGAWGAMTSSPHERKKNIVACVATITLCGLFVGCYLGLASESFRAGQLAAESGGMGLAGVGWYSLGALFSVFSPLVFAFLSLSSVGWLKTNRPGQVFMATILGGQLSFLLIFVSRPDERFLLTLAPLLVIGAALSWSRWPDRKRNTLAWVGAGLMLGVCAEYQLIADSPIETNREWFVAGEEHPPVQHRAWLLADSFEGRGWSSRTTTPNNHDSIRDQLWTALSGCMPSEVAFGGGLSERGDVWWLRYRSGLDRQRGKSDRVHIVLGPTQVGEASFWWPNPDTRPDAPLYYRRLGFSADMLPDDVDTLDLGTPLALQQLGIRPTAFKHFQPRLAVSRLPLSSTDPLREGWTVQHRFKAPASGWTVGLLTRDEAACP